MLQTQHDVFSNDLPTPNLPRRAMYSAPAAASPSSKAPVLDSQKLGGLDPLQRQRLQNESEQAQRSEQELNKVMVLSSPRCCAGIGHAMEDTDSRQARILIRQSNLCPRSCTPYHTLNPA